MKTSTHSHAHDPRNEQILININGELFRRDEAKVSVFDSAFMLGDGVWEGLRVHNGKIAFLAQHLDRLYGGAQVLDFHPGLSRAELQQRLYETLEANGMRDHVHVRLMVSRGTRSTPYQDPRVIVSDPTIVIIPEYKEPLPAITTQGIELFTVHIRRGAPDVQDPRLNSHSKINCILACIQASKAGADEALMLNPHGFVATCNSTHFFIVHEDTVKTSSGRYCIDGVTRGAILRICRDKGLASAETTFSLTEAYNAQEAFVTGTFAGVVPVTSIDGRQIGSGERGPVTQNLQDWYRELLEQETRTPQ